MHEFCNRLFMQDPVPRLLPLIERCPNGHCTTTQLGAIPLPAKTLQSAGNERAQRLRHALIRPLEVFRHGIKVGPGRRVKLTVPLDQRAGLPGRGYYTFKAGTWRVYALSSEHCYRDGGCGPGSAQYRWLKKKLASQRDRP